MTLMIMILQVFFKGCLQVSGSRMSVSRHRSFRDKETSIDLYSLPRWDLGFTFFSTCHDCLHFYLPRYIDPNLHSRPHAFLQIPLTYLKTCFRLALFLSLKDLFGIWYLPGWEWPVHVADCEQGPGINQE